MNAPSPLHTPPPISLPTLPRVVGRIAALLDEPSAGVRDVGALIGIDPPLTARVLQIVNSSYYGLRERCHSPEHACVILGMRVLHDVVLQAALLEDLERLRASGYDVDELWSHSVGTATACGLLARRVRGVELHPDEMYVAGLLHDIGNVVLLDNLRDEYLELIAKAKAEKVALVEVERRELHLSHCDLGLKVATTWGFSPAVAAAIGSHHDPHDDQAPQPSILLRAANRLVDAIAAKAVAPDAVFDTGLRKVLGLSARDVADAVVGTRRALGEMPMRAR